jgi:predicted RNase H-like HicB family nuclease
MIMKIRMRFIDLSGLFIGMSDDLPGLVLCGDTEEEILQDVPETASYLLNLDRPEGAPWWVEIE